MGLYEQIITDTLQLGGVLVFIRDHAPHNVQQWLHALQVPLAGEVPVVFRSVDDLVNGKYRTRSEDLIFFFETQLTELKRPSEQKSFHSLNAILQGQRVCLSAGKTQEKINGIDFVWTEIDLENWQQILSSLAEGLKSLKPIKKSLQGQQSACLFLDRDDVVVRNIPYNKEASKVELMDGCVELIQQAHQKGLWVALVTNQSGIGRGRISWLEYKAVHQRMLQLLSEKNCWIDECVWSSFIENEAVVEGRLYAGLRKPRSGMFQIVHDRLKVKMADSYMVGDSATDLIAAHAAGVGNLYLLESEKFADEEKTLTEYQQHTPEMSYNILKNLRDLKL